MSRKSIIITCIVVVTASVIGLIVYAFIPRANLLISVAPENVTVSVNGKNHKVKTGDSITVGTGELSIRISSDNFDTYTEKVTVKNGEKKEILLALKPQNDTAKKLLETKKSQEVLQRIANVNMKEASDQYVKDYPILKVLPIKDKFYTITSCASQKFPDDVTKIAICVYLYEPQAKQSAIEDVINNGFDLKYYEVYFVDESYDPSAQTGD